MTRIVTLLFACVASGWAASPVSEESVREAFDGIDGGFVLMDCGTGYAFSSNPKLTKEAFGPCSTFKIWNTLIGLEEGIIKGAEDPFWKWDGQERKFPGWNNDQTLREAFKVSCVPAYQELARSIGPERMQKWLEKLAYGNKDQCGRPDGFWLPRAGQKTILISPDGQAQMMCRLLRGDLPVSMSSLAVLKEIMKAESSDRGTLYGKTGSGLRGVAGGPTKEGDFDMGWWVGFLEHNGKQYAFACLVLGAGLSGKDAKRIVEHVFRKNGML